MMCRLTVPVRVPFAYWFTLPFTCRYTHTHTTVWEAVWLLICAYSAKFGLCYCFVFVVFMLAFCGHAKKSKKCTSTATRSLLKGPQHCTAPLQKDPKGDPNYPYTEIPKPKKRRENLRPLQPTVLKPQTSEHSDPKPQPQMNKSVYML